MRVTSLALLMLLLLAACKEVPVLPSLTPYRIDVQQGNAVTQEMVQKLKPGMTRSQVRFILGTPLVVDPFRSDRWDYVYLYYKGGELAEQRRISVIFDQDKLKHVEGDIVPAAAPKDGFAARSDAKSPGTAKGADGAQRTSPADTTLPPAAKAD